MMDTLRKYICVVLLIIKNTTIQLEAISFNQPKLCPNATWNLNATTFATNSTIASTTRGIFIDRNNIIVVANDVTHQIIIWYNESNRSMIMNITVLSPVTLFVTDDNEIIVSRNHSRIWMDRWSLMNRTLISSIPIDSYCHGLFVDVDNDIYCSMRDLHQVAVYSATEAFYSMKNIFGTGCNGSSSLELDGPFEIFVTEEKDLYVADYNNDRIQLFRNGQRNGITVAGNGSDDSFVIKAPSGIIIDGNGYMYIVERMNHRVIRSTPNGTQCILGCSAGSGSISDQLYFPFAVRFDNQGNIYVLDSGNERIRKYDIISSTCNQTSATTTATSMSSLLTTTHTITLNTTASNYSSTQRRDMSYNRPKLSRNARWNPNGTTFATNSSIGFLGCTLFVNHKNSIFTTGSGNNRIFIWHNGSNNNTLDTIEINQTSTFYSVFVTVNDELFVSNYRGVHKIDRWSITHLTLMSSISVDQHCYGLFVDIDDYLYCSLTGLNQVIKFSLEHQSFPAILVAGTGCPGFSPWLLNKQHGIFVTEVKDLYVADYENDRIQLFHYGRRNGITVAGNGSNDSFVINGPTGIVLDADAYMYIVEWDNHRIVRSTPAGTHCILGCSSIFGTGPDQFAHPRFANFDSDGNLYVLEWTNSRIQKFQLIYNEWETATTTISLTTEHPSTQEATRYIFNGSTSFTPRMYPSSSVTSSFSNITHTPCDILQPCFNNGSCFNTNTTKFGYTCSCLPNFMGTDCELDLQLCSSKPCLNSGTCTSMNGAYYCQCTSEWEGNQCETRKNYCANASCQNGGICRSSSSSYQCLCLGKSYSGQYCENKATKTVFLQTFATSMSYISIIIISSFSVFVIMMDVLKYTFHIDPVQKQQKKKSKLKKKHLPVTIIHYFYVNHRN